MMRHFVLSLSFLISSTIGGWAMAAELPLPAATAKEVVLLVPGFFNSFAPEYFSKDIQNAFTQAGFKVYVPKGLNPIGTIEDNGSRLELIMQQIEKLENSSVKFHVVSHSMGGFYAMWVANRQKFKIPTILTVSTPYKGIEFVQQWREKSFLFKQLTELAFLEGLKETSAEGIKNFISSIRLDPKTKLFAFGGYQNKGIDITDAKNMSVPLRITSHYITGQSDGIVGINSALGVGEVLTTDGKKALQYMDNKFFLALEHWEQVLDRKSFIILGIRNTSYIQKEQSRFYSGLADFLKNTK